MELKKLKETIVREFRAGWFLHILSHDLVLGPIPTKEFITINIKDEIVIIRGNGTYKQAIKTDESDNKLILSITFPKVEKLYDIVIITRFVE